MQMGGLSVQCRNHNHQHLVVLAGELDLAGVDRVEDEIDHAEKQIQQTNELKEVVVDTTELSFVDCSGLGALVAARKRLGDRIAVIAGSRLRRLLRLTGTRPFFQAD